MFQTKIVEKIKPRFLNSVHFFFLENCAVYDIMWKIIEQRGRPQMTLCRLSIACWTPTATNKHPGFVIIIAFPLQHLLHELVSILFYTYVAGLVVYAYKEYAVPFYVCVHSPGWLNVNRNM